MAAPWGGETIKDLALPALGGAEHEALRPYSSAPLEDLFPGALCLLVHLSKSCHVPLSAGSLPELTSLPMFFSDYSRPFREWVMAISVPLQTPAAVHRTISLCTGLLPVFHGISYLMGI